jgi:hypothetical protein
LKEEYRYVDTGILENGKPDYRIQKADSWTKRYKDMYLLDNEMQLVTALDDHEYTKWLDPDPEVWCLSSLHIVTERLKKHWSGTPLRFRLNN